MSQDKTEQQQTEKIAKNSKKPNKGNKRFFKSESF